MSLLTAIKSIFGLGSSKSNPGDRTLVCMDCSNKFIFDVGEQAFFKSKGFTDPKRCPSCRKKIKAQLKRKRRGGPRHQQHKFERRPHHSLIDGDSPYADER